MNMGERSSLRSKGFMGQAYQCLKCGHLFVRIRPILAPKCPKCGSRKVTKNPNIKT